LKSGITGRNIYLDPRIVEYSQNHAPLEELPSILEKEKYEHAKEKLLQRFEMAQIRDFTSVWYEKLVRKHPGKVPTELTEVYEYGIAITNQLEGVMMKFRREILEIHTQGNSQEDIKTVLVERCEKAIRYCVQQLDEHWVKLLGKHRYHFQNKPRSKRWERAMDEVWYAAVAKREQLLGMKYLNKPIHPNSVSVPIIHRS